MKEKVVDILFKAIKKAGFELDREKIDSLIEIPKDYSRGDYAFPCFIISEVSAFPPKDVALEIKEEITKKIDGFSSIETSGGYVNFYLDRKKLAFDLIKEVKVRKNKYGRGEIGVGKKILVEFSSPNIAKPFGIGHLRSTIIGNSLGNLLEFQGYKVVRLNYLGDWGSQFGKLLCAFDKFGSEAKLVKDPINHLYKIYVKINQAKDATYENESRAWFKKLEDGDKEAVQLWKRFRALSQKDFEKIYSRLGVTFDKYLSESMYNKKMEKVVNDLDEKGLLVESDGAKIVDLSLGDTLGEHNQGSREPFIEGDDLQEGDSGKSKKDDLGVVLIKKSDGATLYATRDLASAIDRYENYKFDKMIYEVGQEQKMYFKQLFKVLDLMEHSWAENCVHVYHGLYLGDDGKRMQTREGKTVFMEEILDKLEKLAKKEIKKRFPRLAKKKLEERGCEVAKAALFYGDLKNSRTHNVIFDLNKFVSFEGNTGPYLLYSYARAASILRKSKRMKVLKEVKELNEQEEALVLKMAGFRNICFEAQRQLNPAIVANYAYSLAQIFNEFYHICPVIGSDNEALRINLVKTFMQVLKNALDLLGIKTLEEM